MRVRHPLAVLILATALPAAAATVREPPAADGAAALRQRHEQLRQQLEQNHFGQMVHLDSRERGNDLEGDVHAVVDHAFGRVVSGLRDATGWCDIMMLPYNSKHCEASQDALTLFVGRKNDTPVKDAYRLDFKYAVASRSADYLRIVLTSDEGPLGTRAYRVVLEATPLDERRSFLRLSYSYAYGTVSKLAMQTYLATLGRNKVGFSREGEGDDARLVRGMRGVMERNTMRFFLAIDAYLASLNVAPAQRVEKRLNDWFTGTERYPKQLHEMERAEYLALKRGEMQRMASAR